MLPPSVLEPLADRIASVFGLRHAPGEYAELSRKLERMAGEPGAPPDLLARLAASPWGEAETALLARALTVKETYFCRERAAFRAIRDLVLPGLVREREGAGRGIRCWSAACATGEEAYSAAMLFWSALPVPESWQVRITATDLDPAALATAEAARYAPWSFRDVPQGVIDRFFLPGPDGTLLVAPALRQWVSFGRQNLVSDPPPVPPAGPGFDLVICRNVLIYFTPEAIRTAIDRVAGALADGGWLVVGVAEAPFVRHPALVRVPAQGITLFRRQEAAGPAAAPGADPGCRGRPRTVPAGSPRRPRSRPASRPAPPPPPAAEAPSGPEAVRRHADAGDLATGLAAVEAALAADPLDPRLLYLRATILDEQGRPDEAMAAMRQVVYAEPGCVPALYWLGVWALRAGRAGLGRRSLREARARCAALPPGTPVPGTGGLDPGGLASMIDEALAQTR